MRKQTHFKKVVSFALAAAMAVSVCTAALADEATNGATKEASASEQVETQSDGETKDKAVMLTGEADPQDANVAYVDSDTSKTYTTLQDAINNAADQVVLTSNVTESVTIPAGKSIQLNLNDHKITNTADKHTITNNGTLTITGNGTVDNVSHGRAALYNEKDATAIVESGTFTRSQEAGTPSGNGGNSWYVVYNDGTLTFNGGTVEATGKFSSLVVSGQNNASAVMTINNGNFNNDFIVIKAEGGTTNITGGTFNSPEQTLQSWDSITTVTGGTLNGAISSWVWENSTTNGVTISGDAVVNGNLTAANYDNKSSIASSITINGGKINGELKKRNIDDAADATYTGAKFEVTAGTFTKKFSASYLASGLALKENADGTYTVGEKTVDTKPAKPEKTEVSDNAESKVEVKKEDNITASEVVDAAKSTEIVSKDDATTDKISQEVTNSATVTVKGKDVAIDSTEAAEAAKSAISAAATDSSKNFDQDAENKDITIVAVPKLVVEPKAAANNDTDISMTFDIKMLYDVKATVADDVKNMTESNTVTLEKNKEMPAEQVPTVAISLDVSALKIPEDQKVFVRHVKEDGTVYYYEAETKTESGIVKTITFVNPDGFSEFTVMANKTVTVTIDGKEYALSAADIGKGFEIAKKDYCDWKGVSFKGIEGVYTTLTKELYDKAANGQKLEGTNVFEQVWFPPEEPTPAPTAAPTATPAPIEAAPAATTAPTATPDDSQYYTCVACGHHNWTATADGYKCDTCGHLETKQISGYKNVKGTYASTASSAKTAAATASTIPQTSDEMPIVPIAIIAIAALLGLGVTAYMKKKQN
jgi:DNA-directed RNA polymerase subunit RPC12/RpoP